MIGIFDSGVGGLSVFREIRKILPGQSYIYYSDNAHCPYGEKSKEYIIERSRAITDFLLSKGAEIIVIACNTATAAAINTLRKEYPDIRFIGTEPAIKPAISMTRSGVVGVLATAGTLKAEKYRNTKELANGKVTVAEHIGKGFVELVESGQTSGPDAEELVRASVLPLVEEGADVIVLGCTHYPFLLDLIQKAAGKDVKIINPAPAIARHLAEVMAEENIPPTDLAGDGNNRISLYSSGDRTALESLAATNLSGSEVSF